MKRLLSVFGHLVALITAFGLLARYVSPAEFWPPTVIALFLPGLLLATLLFVVVQIYFRRWRSLLLPALVLLLSLPALGRLFAWPDRVEDTAVSGPRLSVTTANIRAFKDGTELIDSVDVKASINRFDADVLLLQEARYPRHTSNYIDAILEWGGYARPHQLPLKSIATYAAEVEPVHDSFGAHDNYNGFLVTDVGTDLGTIRIINAHLQSNQISGMAGRIREDGTLERKAKTFKGMLAGYGRKASIRARQAEEIRHFIEESPHPVIVGGDFNDVPTSYTYHLILTPRLRDAWGVRGSGMGTTFTGPLPGLRIDYLLVDTAFTVQAVERLPAAFSDHRPLRVELGK